MEKSAFFNSKLLPYLLLVPQLVVTFVFFYWPASQALWQSFLREDAFGLSAEFIGLENYQALFADPQYYKAMLTTVVFSTLVAALSLSIRAVVCHPGRQESEGGAGLQDLHDLALCGGAGGGRRALDLHVSALARHPRAALCARWASTGIRF